MPRGVDKDYVGLEIPQIGIFKLYVLRVTVVSRFVEGWCNSLRQEKQLQRALDFRGRGATKNRNSCGDEIRLFEQFLL